MLDLITDSELSGNNSIISTKWLKMLKLQSESDHLYLFIRFKHFAI